MCKSHWRTVAEVLDKKAALVMTFYWHEYPLYIRCMQASSWARKVQKLPSCWLEAQLVKTCREAVYHCPYCQRRTGALETVYMPVLVTKFRAPFSYVKASCLIAFSRKLQPPTRHSISSSFSRITPSFSCMHMILVHPQVCLLGYTMCLTRSLHMYCYLQPHQGLSPFVLMSNLINS